jgi:hypothetical protein
LRKQVTELKEDRDEWKAWWFDLECVAIAKEANLLKIISEMGSGPPFGGGLLSRLGVGDPTSVFGELSGAARFNGHDSDLENLMLQGPRSCW